VAAAVAKEALSTPPGTSSTVSTPPGKAYNRRDLAASTPPRPGKSYSVGSLAASALKNPISITPRKTYARESLAEIAAGAVVKKSENTPRSNISSGNSQTGNIADDESPIPWVSTPTSSWRQDSASARRGGTWLSEESTCDTLLTSRRVLFEINAQARFEALHIDSDCRRLRREAAERKKLERDEEETKQLLRPLPQRAWEKGWVDKQLAAHTKKLSTLRKKSHSTVNSREAEALQECSFTPQLLSQEVPRQRRLLKARQHLEGLAYEQEDLALRLEELRSEQAQLTCAKFESGCEEPESVTVEGFPGRPAQRIVAEAFAEQQRYLHNSIWQVLDQLATLEKKALAFAAHASRGTTSQLAALPEPTVALAELCPLFDLTLLQRVWNNPSDLNVPHSLHSGQLCREASALPVLPGRRSREASSRAVSPDGDCAQEDPLEFLKFVAGHCAWEDHSKMRKSPHCNSAWKVPGELLKPPRPVPMKLAREAEEGATPTEGKPWA